MKTSGVEYEKSLIALWWHPAALMSRYRNISSAEPLVTRTTFAGRIRTV